MKLVALEGARILDLVPVEELRPTGGIYLPDFISAISQRYQFTSGPTNLGEALKQGAKFEHGKFVISDGPVVVKELAIYTDGIICDAFDTRTADLILDDFLAWATETFKLRERISPPHRTYTSAVVVAFETAVEPALGKLAQVCELLSRSLKAAYGWDYHYNLLRFGFSVDPRTIPHLRNTAFTIERRVNAPYEENRYYSFAPLQTEEHLRVLEQIERLVA
jgi:hypothetical protein